MRSAVHRALVCQQAALRQRASQSWAAPPRVRRSHKRISHRTPHQSQWHLELLIYRVQASTTRTLCHQSRGICVPDPSPFRPPPSVLHAMI